MIEENKDPFPGDEPYIDGEEIDQTWRYAWARCVARIWYEEHTDNKTSWYDKIFCKDPELVLEALEDEGFIVDGDSISSSENKEKWVNAKIVVKQANEKIKVGDKEIQNPQIGSWEYNEKKNGWMEVEGLKHTLVLTVPPRPEKPEQFALALADLQAAGRIYPFTPCC